jgi:hypothetical protein
MPCHDRRSTRVVSSSAASRSRAHLPTSAYSARVGSLSSRGPGRTVTWLIALLVMLGGCGAGAETPLPSGPLGSFESPLIEMDPVLCDALDRVSKELRDVRDTRLRRSVGDLLQRRFEDIRVMANEADRVAPYELAAHLNSMWDAVTQLGLAVEDYRTTNNPAEAIAYIRRSITQLQRTLTRFRRAASCAPD